MTALAAAWITMDNKNFWRALFWAALVFLTWQMIAFRIWPPPKQPAGRQGTTTAPAVATTQQADNVGDIAGVATQPAATAGGKLRALGADEPQSITLGDVTARNKSPFRMEVEINNIGASIERLRLSDHQENIKSDEPYTLLSPVDRSEKDPQWRSLSIEKVVVDSVSVPLADLPWHATFREENAAHVAELSATILDEDKPVLKLVRTFRLAPQPAEKRRCDLDISLAIHNISDKPHNVIVTEHGAVGLKKEGLFRPDRKVYAAVMTEGQIQLAAKSFSDVVKRTHLRLYPQEQGTSDPLLWWADVNLYFTCTLCPVGPDGSDMTGRVALIEGVDLDESSATENDVTTRAVTTPLRIEPGAVETLLTQAYMGPKDREAFENSGNEDYLRRGYMRQIKEGYGSCTFNFLTDLMIRLLNWLESVFHNFGVAIIFLVVIVRVILHPITKKTQVNMVKMQKNMGRLQPRMDELKKKCGNDNRKYQEEVMKLYREEGMNPVGQVMGCLPMLLQMPIWVALYSSLSNNVAMRGRGFILWINDLTAPDNLIPFQHPVHLPLLGEINGFHLLPILVGVTMFAQQKLMPKPARAPTASSSSQAQQAEQMQKMMPYMSLVMIFLFYRFPSGLNLYIMTSSLFGALEQWYIRNHIKSKDLEKPATSAPKPADKPRKAPSFIEKLVKQAEDAQKMQGQRKNKKK